ncbi:MAG: hypothetical protein D6681_15630 [Calditrichaeota bacterium]|nr:MAG: hypothetical protein D6681_15630 [Calditrichota bacterium]
MWLFPGILVVLLLCSCQREQIPPGEIVARVGEAYLTREVVLSLVPADLSQVDREFFIRKIVEQWIEDQLLAQKAAREGVELSSAEEWQVERLRAELLATKFLNSRIRENLPVTDQEVEDYYQAHTQQFVRDADEVHLVHLYFEKLDKAIVREIRQSKSLLSVIENNPYLKTQVSRVIEPNGDLGYVPVEQLRSEFQRAIRGKKTGVIYGPIRTKDGYHFLQVLDRQPKGSVRSLDLVREEIVVFLKFKKRQERIRQLKENIRKEIPVETFYNHVL